MLTRTFPYAPRHEQSQVLGRALAQLESGAFQGLYPAAWHAISLNYSDEYRAVHYAFLSWVPALGNSP